LQSCFSSENLALFKVKMKRMQIGREREYRQKKKHAKRGEKQTGLKKKIYQDFITNNFC